MTVVNFAFTEDGKENGAQAPLRKHHNDAGADLFAAQEIVVPARDRVTVKTGICMELPEETAGFINPRSGLAEKKGITVLNAPGTSDAGYRGEVKVLLINHSDEDVLVSRGERIAQLVIVPVILATFKEVDSLSDSERGANGFGSTGMS